MSVGLSVAVSGIVQGVGFRPFVYNLARRMALRGQVQNTGAGVRITVIGPSAVVDEFLLQLREHAPPLASIESISVNRLSPDQLAQADAQHSDFRIVASSGPSTGGGFVPVAPDVALCHACRRELFDPGDRRYRYPFINCTNCGPRYTIIRDVPYDRPATTMADFDLCPACRAEYEDPGDRRFHAQPNACAACGPRLWFTRPDPLASPSAATTLWAEDALQAARAALRQGEILAVKGIGGFHLACDATNADAVTTLRARKQRPHKPLAVMAASLAVVQDIVELSAAARADLQAPARPIVLAPKGKSARYNLAPQLAPDSDCVGVMLPYAPLHELLFAQAPDATAPCPALVMTSGNLSEEPIAIDNEEAVARLGRLADAFLLHDRPIHIACDDSVLTHAPDLSAAAQGSADATALPIVIRRSRGYAPQPLALPFTLAPVLAVGGELKNTLCVARDRHAFLSGHIGDLANLETLNAFEQTAQHMQQIFRVEPQLVACDLHPNFLGTRWAQVHAHAHGLPLVQVQHHHAHAAALMAEHALAADETILAVTLDGTGYGPDATIWGGEFLLCGYGVYRRLGRLRPLPLAGGDASVRRPYRMALAALWDCGLDWQAPEWADLPPVAACPAPEASLLRQQLALNFNCVPTSSMGRVFDAIAALCGVCTHAGYEAQAAMRLETLAFALDPRLELALDHQPYPFTLLAEQAAAHGHTAPLKLGQSQHDQVEFEIDTRPVFRSLAQEVIAQLESGPGEPSLKMLPEPKRQAAAMRSHITVAAMVETGCRTMRDLTGLDRVGLTGGVFQNRYLLSLTRHRLQQAGFQVLTHSRIPANDGGLALGQAVIAAQRIAT